MFILLALPLHPINGPAEHFWTHEGLYGIHGLAQERGSMPDYLSQSNGFCDTWRIIQSTCGWSR